MPCLALYVLVFIVTPVACNLCNNQTNTELVARVVFGTARHLASVCQLAVAYTVINRVNEAGYPKDVTGVLNQRYNGGRKHHYHTLDRSRDNAAWLSAKTSNAIQYRNAVNVADDALCGRKSDPTSGATNFCGRRYCPALSNIIDFIVDNISKLCVSFFARVRPRQVLG